MFSEFCRNVIRTWNGAIADTTANRLIIWGGGHNNYYGNEIYSLNLAANPITLTRLKDPTIPTNFSNYSNCIDGIPPGSPDFAPNSREDYGGLVFLPTPYRMMILNGSLGCLNGNGSFNTWTISLSNLSNSTQWVHENTTLVGPQPGLSGGDPYGTVADYDPNSGLAFVMDNAAMYSYNYQTNTYTRVTTAEGFVTNIYLSGAIDPTRKLFVLVGNCPGGSCTPGSGVFVADISNPAMVTQQNWTAATLADPVCAEYLAGGANPISAANPGIAFDSVANDFVGWPNQGNSVYIMTPDTQNRRLTCQKLTFANGPPNSSHANNTPNTSYGTFGRFRYFPALDAFVLINDANIPPYILRLRSSTNFTLSGTPSSASTDPGGSVSYTVTATGLNGFNGSIGLGASNLPSGATASFNPPSITPGSSSVLTVNTSAATPVANSNITITGTSGSQVGNTIVSLNVLQPADFSLSATPPTVTVAPGGTAKYTIGTASLSGFSGAVNLTVSGLPSGASSAFSPVAPNAGANSLLTITTLANTPAGSSTLTITGTSGSLIHSVNVTLNVSSTAQSTIQYIQSNYADPQSSAARVSITYGLQQAAGDLNVVVVGWADTSTNVGSVTDTSGNVYTLAAGPTQQPGFLTQSIYYAKNIAAAATNGNTVTVTFSAAASFPDVRILEYSGADLNNPLDVMVAGTGTSSPTSSGPLATNNPNDLLFGATTVWTSNTGAGTGYALRILSQPDHDLVEDQMVTQTGSYTATAPLNNAGPWIMHLIAFKAAGVSGGATPPTAPTNLTATAVSATQINLSWTASTPGSAAITGYQVQQCQGASCTSFAQIGTATGTTFSAMGLSSGTSYSYRVRAVDANNNLSNYSTTAAATTTGGVVTIGFVQSNYAVPHIPSTSVGITYTLAQTAGNLNVVVVGWADSTTTVSSVGDTLGNTYTLAIGPTVQPGFLTQSVYYAKNIRGAAPNGNTVTVTFSAGAAFPDIRILEYSGADPNNPLDIAVAGTGTNSPTNSGTLTTTNANDLLLGASMVETSNTAAGPSYTLRILTQPDHDIVEDEIVSTIGSYSATAPLNNPGPWIMQLLAFRAHT